MPAASHVHTDQREVSRYIQYNSLQVRPAPTSLQTVVLREKGDKASIISARWEMQRVEDYVRVSTLWSLLLSFGELHHIIDIPLKSMIIASSILEMAMTTYNDAPAGAGVTSTSSVRVGSTMST